MIPAYYEEIKKYDKKGQRLRNDKKCIERECAYMADFVYVDKNGQKVIEDTKGVRTKDYIIKRKLMLFRYGIKIKEV